MAVQITGLGHLYIPVSDLERSMAFWDPVLRALDFRKGTTPIVGEPHAHYYNRVLQITLRPARGGREYDAYATGAIHHLALTVATREDVDAVAAELRSLGVTLDEGPGEYGYAPGYYALFFRDPDGIRIEVMAELAIRQEAYAVWEELTDFEDALQKWRARRRG
jgi:catechol 2,3-dioxygenase-like lactoylglutathione lyase family enzyme